MHALRIAKLTLKIRQSKITTASNQVNLYTCSCCSHTTEPICGYTSGVGSRKTRLVLVALVVGLPKIGRYLVLLIMCRQKNRWCWYSLIMGRGATNTGGAGIPNTSQQA